MAFVDAPIVDENSQRSEESVLRIRSILSRKNSFLCREETPDYGVDIDVELIDESVVTGKKFPIQVKSSRNLKTVDNQGVQCISYPYPTSNLGYLSRRLPCYGLIAIYDEDAEVTYFDYVDEIIFRLGMIKKNDTWRLQNSVSIYIPVKNILSDESAQNIWRTFTERFSKHGKMFREHAVDYDIPVLSMKENLTYDISHGKVAADLEKYGFALFNTRELHLLLDMLEELSVSDISTKTHFTTLAAIAYAEIGKLIDAEYYLGILYRSETSLTETETFLRDYS